jgi:Tfp pilus assembly protein PilN
MSAKLLTIDLLKGQGVPTRSNPEKIVLMAITILVPMMMSIAMFGYFWKNNVLISIEKQKIANCDKSIKSMARAQALLDRSEKEKRYRNDCLAEVAEVLDSRYQWTPGLIEIVKLMPDSVLLKSVETKQSTIKKTVPSKQQDGQMVELAIPVTKMKITVTERLPGSGPQIREFQNNLRTSKIFGPILESVSVSQGVDSYREQSAVSYQIECAFKPAKQ